MPYLLRPRPTYQVRAFNQSINNFDNRGMTLHIMSLIMGSMMSFIVGYLFLESATGIVVPFVHTHYRIR